MGGWRYIPDRAINTHKKNGTFLDAACPQYSGGTRYIPDRAILDRKYLGRRYKARHKIISA